MGFQGIPWLASNVYAYPLLEAAHITGIAMLLGNLVLLEVRVWGAARELPLPVLARWTLTLALSGFGIVAASGLLMFASQPQEMLANRAFVIKMGLIALAGCNAAWFHARGGVGRPDATARALTALSSGLWIAAIISGRWIGYL
jgi:hypothetical protein